MPIKWNIVRKNCTTYKTIMYRISTESLRKYVPETPKASEVSSSFPDKASADR